MNKQLAVAVACMTLVSLQAKANLVYTVTAGYLYFHDGTTPLSQDRLAVFVADTGNDGLASGPLSAGLSLRPGSFIGNDLILTNWDLSSPGIDGGLVNILDVNYGGYIVGGMQLGLYWFDGSTLANQQTVAGTWFGDYQDFVGIDYSEPWILPYYASANLDLRFYTVSTGFGTNPESAGVASMPIATEFIPEPSTVVLAGLGLLCFLGLARRQNQ